MKIAVGFDHGGFPLKQTALDTIREAGHEPIDMGTNSAEAVDFPDFTGGQWMYKKPGFALTDEF